LREILPIDGKPTIYNAYHVAIIFCIFVRGSRLNKTERC
jgi:hypothetical protein